MTQYFSSNKVLENEAPVSNFQKIMKHNKSHNLKVSSNHKIEFVIHQPFGSIAQFCSSVSVQVLDKKIGGEEVTINVVLFYAGKSDRGIPVFRIVCGDKFGEGRHFNVDQLFEESRVLLDQLKLSHLSEDILSKYGVINEGRPIESNCEYFWKALKADNQYCRHVDQALHYLNENCPNIDKELVKAYDDLINSVTV